MPRNRKLKGTDAFPKQTGNHCAFLNNFCDTLVPSDDYIKTTVVREIYLEYVKTQMPSADSKILDHAKKGFFRQFRIESYKRNFRYRTKPRGYYISINRTIRSRIDKNINYNPTNPKVLCEKIFIDNKIGHGVFAKVNILKQTRVLQYEGQWVSKKIHDEREVMYAKNESPPVDVHDKRTGLVLDGNRDKFGNLFSNDENIARFLNHSRKNPNCKLVKVMDTKSDDIKLFIVTKVCISKGSELRWNYNDTENGKKYDHLDTVDITFLIEDEFEPITSECHIASYIEDIPSDTIGYKLHIDKIMADEMKNCCARKCANIISNDSNIVKPVQDMRAKYYMTKTGNERTTKLLDLIRTSMCAELDERLRLHNFMGQVICMHKWVHLLGISKATYYRALVLVRKGFYTCEQIRKSTCSNVKGLSASGFISWFLEKYGDSSPERQKVLLPSCINVKYIYEEYRESPGPHLKEKHFYCVFRKNFGKVVSFAKTRNINPCDICLKAKNELPKLNDARDKHQLKRDLGIHLERQSNERKDYYRKRQEACMTPSEALSIIVDGMDQAKTNLPHFRGWCKPKSGSMVLKTHITGAIMHGQSNSFYIDLNQWPHDPNMTITCLLNSLCRGRRSFPPKLYIQCDNCGRENKNKYVLGFLAYLCVAGYVKEIYLSFLLKGHTHEDIDQRFSVISQHLRTLNAMTLPQLQKAVEGSFLQTPIVEVMGTVWDVKKWIDDFINNISNHSYPHQFWLYCDRPNHVTLKTRMWSTDNWAPEEDEMQLEILDLDINGEQKIPTGQPDTCRPDYEKLNLTLGAAAIKKMKVYLTYEENEWWQNFFRNKESVQNNEAIWPLSNIKKLHRVEDMQIIPQVNLGTSCLRPMLDAEEEVREVITKRRKNKTARNTQN